MTRFCRWAGLWAVASVALGGGQALAYPTVVPVAVRSSTAAESHKPAAVSDGNGLSRWQARAEREGAWVELRLPGPRELALVRGEAARP